MTPGPRVSYVFMMHIVGLVVAVRLEVGVVGWSTRRLEG